MAILRFQNMAAVRHLELSKFRDCHVASMAMLFCFPVQNFINIGQSAAELWPKMSFKTTAFRHLKF